MMRGLKKTLGAVIGALAISGSALAENFVSPDILVLGDSQISFGSGPGFLEFFSHIDEHCNPNAQQKASLSKLDEMRVAVIGVRSTSIGAWIARSGRLKDTICKVDPKWHVNAGTYGFINTSGNKYVQIGQGKEYQFCAPSKSAFEVMFRPDYYQPKLLMMSFLGNSASRWAKSKDAAKKDVQEMMRQLPSGIPCIFMTTAPSFKKDVVALRKKAQDNLMAAFEETGSQCSFVPGSTPETVAANQGNTRYFRLNKNGMVKDPYHPNARAAANFFALETENICNAIFEQLN